MIPSPPKNVRPDVRFVGHQPVEDVDALIGAAPNEMAEQRDELVGHMVVADAAAPAIADMVLGQQVLLVKVPLGAVGRRVLARAPVAWQFKLVVCVDHLDDGLVQQVFADVFQVEP